MKPVFHRTLRAANVARQAEWPGGDKLDLSFRGVELAGEVGEACNVIKKLERERLGVKGSRASVEQLADELADVVICADLAALQMGIDLEEAISRKFNATSVAQGLSTRLTRTARASECDLSVINGATGRCERCGSARHEPCGEA